MNGVWIAALISLWAVVIVLLMLLLGFLRRVLPVIERAEQLIEAAGHPRRQPVEFPEQSLNGAAAQLPALILFSAEDCSRCETLLAEINEAGTEILGVPLVILDGRQAPPEMGLPGLPFAFAVDSSRKIVGAVDPERLDDLIGLATRLSDHVLSPDG